MRTKLVKIVADNRLLIKKEQKKQSTFNVTSDQDRKDKQGAINFLKQTQVLSPCMGSGYTQMTGKKITDCIFLNYEDYNKLIKFDKMSVSGFIEDLVQYMTIGLVSPQAIEMYLGHLRNTPDDYDFTKET